MTEHRLTFPAKFRADFAGGVVLTQGFEGRCLYAFSREDWERVIEQRGVGHGHERNVDALARRAGAGTPCRPCRRRYPAARG